MNSDSVDPKSGPITEEFDYVLDCGAIDAEPQPTSRPPAGTGATPGQGDRGPQRKFLPESKLRVRREKLAKKGRWQPLLDELCDTTDPRHRFRHVPTLVRNISKAMERSVRDDAAAFGQAHLERAVGLLGFFAGRTECLIRSQLESHDSAMSSAERRPARIPPGIADELLPSYLRIVQEIGELVLLDANISRQRELTRASRLKSDAMEAALGGQAHILAQRTTEEQTIILMNSPTGAAKARIDGQADNPRLGPFLQNRSVVLREQHSVSSSPAL